MVASVSAQDDPASTDEPEVPIKADKAKPRAPSAKAAAGVPLAWSDSLTKGLTQAQRDRRPILVRGEGDHCPYCRIMAKELLLPQVQQELQRWNLVAIDVEKASDEAQKLAIDAIPAFRLLTPTGKVVASEEGAMSGDKFVEWLKQHFEAASAVPAAELSEQGEPDSKAVFQLIRQFRNREAAVREAAIRRLLPYPDVAATPVVAVFTEGSLSARLVAYELLQEWKAPVGEIDPWRAETLNDARLKTLTEWAATAKRILDAPAKELTPEELAAARDMLDRLPQVTPPEATAIRERLARYGRQLLPEVTTRIKAAATDEARERLTAVRYRLVATDALVLAWPGGIERLAATDANLRTQAADELIRRATATEEPLLLELFSDPSPLIRELSLRALRTVGGASVNSALVNLLNDPEPNVRAAVLKQLAEEPATALVPKIVVYVLAEKDPDLVSHGTRVLSEMGDQKPAREALLKLMTHESWRVRAEAIEGLGKAAARSSNGASASVEIYVKIVDLLKDPDGFVVSRAINILTKADLAAAIDPLVGVVKTHPDLAPEVVKALAQSSKQRAKALPHIKTFLAHENPKVRAAAISALCGIIPGTIQQEMRAALQDRDSDVRVAAAQGLFRILENKRASLVAVAGPVEPEESDEPRNAPTPSPPPPPPLQFEEAPPTGVLGGLLQIFAPAPPPRPRLMIRPVPRLAPPRPPEMRNVDGPNVPADQPAERDPSISEPYSQDDKAPAATRDGDVSSAPQPIPVPPKVRSLPSQPTIAVEATPSVAPRDEDDVAVERDPSTSTPEGNNKSPEAVRDGEDPNAVPLNPVRPKIARRAFQPKPPIEPAPAGNMAIEDVAEREQSATVNKVEDAKLPVATRDAPGAAAAGTDAASEKGFNRFTRENLPAVDPVEIALQRIREGKGIEKEWYDCVELLKPFLTRERSEERMAGALTLLALGQDQLALPVLEKELTGDPRMVSQVALALPWTLATDRQRLFEAIVQKTKSLEDLHHMVSSLGTLRSPRTEAMLWSLAADTRVDALFAGELRDAMIQYYLNQYPYYIAKATTSKKKRAIAAAIPRSKEGPDWQRLIALSLLVPLDAAAAKESATSLMEHVQSDPVFRGDGLQILFLTTSHTESRRLALVQLASDVPELRSRALAYIAQGRVSLATVQKGKFSVQTGDLDIGVVPSATKGVPITPEPPEGVTAEQLLTFLSSDNPRDAALAGYLLVLLDHPEGFSPLLEYWEHHGRDDIPWMRLVYRAISHLDDASYVNVLKEIYQRLVKDKYFGEEQIPELYWTIRIMTGPEILSLRKTIRTEFGAARLNN